MKIFITALSCFAVVSAGGVGYFPKSFGGVSAGSFSRAINSAHGYSFGRYVSPHARGGHGSFVPAAAVVNVIPKMSYGGVAGGYRGSSGSYGGTSGGFNGLGVNGGSGGYSTIKAVARAGRWPGKSYEGYGSDGAGGCPSKYCDNFAGQGRMYNGNAYSIASASVSASSSW